MERLVDNREVNNREITSRSRTGEVEYSLPRHADESHAARRMHKHLACEPSLQVEWLRWQPL
jgi:hypothetical protein